MPVTTSNVSTVYLQELTRDQLLQRAFQLAGVVPIGQSPTAEQASALSDMLLLELQSLQNKGVVLNTVVLKTKVMIAGTASYALPDDTLDVVGVAMMTPTSGTEVPVQPMSRDDYFSISNKSATGTPSRYYIERKATVTVYLWPTPASSTDYVFSYQQVRLLKNTDTGAKTFDLERYWHKYLLWEMAHQAAVLSALPLERIVYLRGQSVKLQTEAISYNRPHGPSRIFLGHRVGSWR